MANPARVPASEVRNFRDHSRRAYRAHVAIALGSTGELEPQLEIARRLRPLNERLVESLIERCATVGRLAQGLWRSLKPVKTVKTVKTR